MDVHHPLVVALTAFTIVMVGMAFLTVVLAIFRRLAQRSARRAAAAAEAAGISPGEETIDEELVAVLAAAAREVLGAPVRLYQVHVHRGGGVERWSRAGRMDVMISHRMEPKR